MSQKTEILELLDSGYIEFRKTFEGLDDVQMAQIWLEDWSVHDILAHVAGWHRVMTGSLDRVARGERPTPEGVDYSDADAWNEGFSKEKKGISPRAMVNELQEAFEAFRSAVDTVPDDRFEPGRTVDRLIRVNAIDHYVEHGTQITLWREKG